MEPRACIPFSGHQEVKTGCKNASVSIEVGVKNILLVGLSSYF